MVANDSLFYPECGPMPYESIYSIYLKLSHLNRIKTHAMDRPLNIVSERQWSGHILTNWLESNVANIGSHLPWRYAPCGYINNTIEGFRFCRECIKFGYHSVFNNIKTHNVCVLHKCFLTKACLHCAREYMGGFRSGQSIPHFTSECNSCGFQCIELTREIRMRQSPELIYALEKFGQRQAEWYESIFDFDILYFKKYCAHEEFRDYQTGPLEVLLKSQSPETLAGLPQGDQSFIFVGLDKKSDYCQPYVEMQLKICEQIEARHLGRHQNCLKRLNDMIRYPDGSETTIDLCPMSLAYLILRIKGIYGKWPIPGSSSINIRGMTEALAFEHVSDPIINYRSAFLVFLSILGRLQFYISKGRSFAILCRPEQRYLIKGESGCVIIKKAKYTSRSMCRSAASKATLFRNGVGGPILVLVATDSDRFKSTSAINKVLF